MQLRVFAQPTPITLTSMSGQFSITLLVIALIAAIVVVQARREVVTPTERAVDDTLHTAGIAAPAYG